MRIGRSGAALAGLMAAVALAATGCATKGYVRARVNPLSDRVATVETQTGALDKKIDGVDESAQRAASHAEEVARGAEGSAKDAATAAGKAQNSADASAQQANAARNLAEKGLARTTALETTVENMDRYQLVSEQSIQFGFASSELTADAKRQADELAVQAGALKRYVMEVEGYTDSSGPADYNRALGARRAESVVRYLTVNAKLPLYRVHSLGVGDESPVESNQTRDGRQKNRRVEIRLYAPPATLSDAATASLTGK